MSLNPEAVVSARVARPFCVGCSHGRYFWKGAALPTRDCGDAGGKPSPAEGRPAERGHGLCRRGPRVSDRTLGPMGLAHWVTQTTILGLCKTLPAGLQGI